jgi:hypothetical protein
MTVSCQALRLRFVGVSGESRCRNPAYVRSSVVRWGAKLHRLALDSSGGATSAFIVVNTIF